MIPINKYEKIKVQGTISEVIITTNNLEPEPSYSINLNTVEPSLEWPSCVIKVAYSIGSATSSSYFKCINNNNYNPDYVLKTLTSENITSNIHLHMGILRERDIEIIYGTLPKQLSKLRRSILNYIADQHEDIEYDRPYHWCRAYIASLQMLEGFGLISFYRYIQPLHCKEYSLLQSLVIPKIIKTNQAAEKASTLIPLVAKCKSELQSLGISLDSLASIADCLDSNRSIAPLLEGICILILAGLTKPERFKTWIL
jgi:hypothetical protein